MEPLHHCQHTATGSSTKVCSPFCQWRVPHYKCVTHDEHHRLEVLSTLPPTIQVFMLYRITNQLFAIPIQPYPQPSSVTTRGLHLRYMILFCQTDIYSRSYFPSTIRLWNQIPHKVVTCPTLVTFNGRVATIMSDQGF